jgi:hypothetical protein
VRARTDVVTRRRELRLLGADRSGQLRTQPFLACRGLLQRGLRGLVSAARSLHCAALALQLLLQRLLNLHRRSRGA